MITGRPSSDPDAPAVVVDIGNTSVDIGTWSSDQVKTPLSVPADDNEGIESALAAHFEAAPQGRPAATVIASVVPAVLEHITRWVQDKVDRDPLVVGDKIPLPIDLGVTDKRAIGVDRVCAAFAAYDKLEGACIVVDFGTAVTVDLVNDDGVLAGGAILPGPTMQLGALHEKTAVLPGGVVPAFPELPYGRNTVEAMQTGVCRGLVGAIRALVEGYAASLGRWPQVVATGGDLPLIAQHCDFLDTQVKHLTLRGIGRSYTTFLRAAGA